jgi:hypothetical protein
MAAGKTSSEYDLFNGRLRFTDEPLWFRLVICLTILGAAVFLLFVLHQYALPALGVRWLSHVNWMGFLRLGKSRSS